MLNDLRWEDRSLRNWLSSTALLTDDKDPVTSMTSERTTATNMPNLNPIPMPAVFLARLSNWKAVSAA